LTKEQILKFDLPIAPFAEQRRIVAKTEAVLAKVRSSQDRLDKIPTIIKRFRQAVLATACDGRLTHDLRRSGAGFGREVELGEIAAEIRTGPFGSALHKSDYVASGVPVINPVNLVQGKIVPSAEISINRGTFNRLRDYALRTDDIIIARRGEMGRCALVTSTQSGWLCGTGSAILRLKPEARPAYIALVISSPAARTYLSEASVGTTMENLNQKLFKAMPVFLPSVAEQDEIVRRVQDLHKFADRLEVRHAKAKTHVDKVTQSVLAKAFRGQLVTTEAELARREGREYETAERLLERIQATKGGDGSTGRRLR
jgi:type I restriction enzyme S subunit